MQEAVFGGAKHGILKLAGSGELAFALPADSK